MLKTKYTCDMFAKGIIDPVKVVRTALQDLASIVGLLVTTEAMIADKPEEKMPLWNAWWNAWRHGWYGVVCGGMGYMFPRTLLYRVKHYKPSEPMF